MLGESSLPASFPLRERGLRFVLTSWARCWGLIGPGGRVLAVVSSELEGGGWLAELAAEDADDSAGWMALVGRVCLPCVSSDGGGACFLSCKPVGVDTKSSTAAPTFEIAAKGRNPPDELSSSSSASPSELNVPSACDFLPSGARLKA